MRKYYKIPLLNGYVFIRKIYGVTIEKYVYRNKVVECTIKYKHSFLYDLPDIKSCFVEMRKIKSKSYRQHYFLSKNLNIQ